MPLFNPLRKLSFLLLFGVFGLHLIWGIATRDCGSEQLEGKYVKGPDAYRYFRQVRLIVDDGSLPQIDKMRHFPEGIDNRQRTTFFPYLLANIYQVTHNVFPDINLHEFAIYYPIISFPIAILLLFILAWLLLNGLAAMFMLLITPITPVLLYDFSIGYIDTNAFIHLCSLSAIITYFMAFKTSRFIYRIVWGGISGMLTAILGLGWLGSGIFSIIIGLITILLFINKRFKYNDLVIPVSWATVDLLILLGSSALYRSFSSIYVSLPILIPLFIPVILFLYFLVIDKIYFCLLKEPWIWILTSGIIGYIAIALIVRDLLWILRLLELLVYPFGRNIVMKQVSELTTTNLFYWWFDYGLLLPIGFIAIWKSFVQYMRITTRKAWELFFIILILCITTFIIYYATNSLNNFNKTRFLLLLAWGIMLMFGIFQYTRNAIMCNGISIQQYSMNDLVNAFLIPWLIISFPLAASIVRFQTLLAPVLLLFVSKQLGQWSRVIFAEDPLHLKKSMFALSILSWESILCGEFIDRLIVHYFLRTSVPILPFRVQLLFATIVTLVFFGLILNPEKSQVFYKKYFTRYITMLLIIGITIFGPFKVGLAKNTWILARLEEVQPDSSIRNRLEWMRQNLSEDSVIAAPWELGSSINELAYKATIVDEEQDVERICEMNAKLSFGTEKEAIKFLKSYDVTHLLSTIDVFNILGRLSYIKSEPSQNMRSLTFPIRFNSASDYVYDTMEFTNQQGTWITNTDLSSDKKMVQHYRINRIRIPYQLSNGFSNITQPPTAEIETDSKIYNRTVREVFINDQAWYFPNASLNGTLLIIGKHKGTGSVRLLDIHSVYYLTSNARNLWFVKLFLGDPVPGFQLEYSTNNTRLWSISDPAGTQYQSRKEH